MMLHATRRLLVLTMIGLMAIAVNLAATQTCAQAQFEAFVDFAKGLQTWGKDDAAIQFLKPAVNLELSFVKRVCEPTDQQMTDIVAAAISAYLAMDDILQDKNARRIVRNVNGIVNVVGPNNERLVENPYVRIRKDAARYLKPILTTGQYERYVKESDERIRFEREAAISIAVNLVDDKLVLTDQQRDQLSKSLFESWKSVDVQQMQMYSYNPQYTPMIDAAALSAVLTPKQLAAWKTHASTNFSINIGQQADMGLGEDWIK